VFGLDGEQQEPFILHYNFPPYSVGEVRPLRGPGRREIGHGALARRGLAAAVPPFEEFPYTIRIESEISESNGSSSMATVCGGCLAMLDAGVPMKRPVAGIAMGLITDGERTVVLSDILGDEDHLGDMDFKVVGTEQGITALQLDNKIGGLAPGDLAEALEQAQTGIRHILGEMAKTLAAPRKELSTFAPRVFTTAILPESIGALVGPRGANIKAIQASTEARISINDDGRVHVYASDGVKAKRALQAVGKSAGIVCKGKYYTGIVTKVTEFGAFVRVNEVNEGLVPRDELEERAGRRHPSEVVAENDEVVVRVLGLDERGRLRLSRRAAIDVDPALIEY
jgi:polyribonucleotide nucleotidyltransferase